MFKGTIPALITPFLPTPADRPAVDWKTFEDLVDWQLESGVDGLVIYGTTGESPTLSVEEKFEMTKRTVAIVKGRVPVVAGTGSNDTYKTVEFTRAVKELGVDGALVVNPYYNKPTQEGLFQHFKAVAEKGGLPVIVYNIPGRTGVNVSIETFKRLATVPGIVAVKEAAGSADQIMMLAETVGDKLALLSGEDSLVYLLMAAGGKGVIAASGSVLPKEFVKLTTAMLNGDFATGLKTQIELLPAIRAFFMETNPAPIKAALKMLGRIPNETLRAPLVPVGDATRKALREALNIKG